MLRCLALKGSQHGPRDRWDGRFKDHLDRRDLLDDLYACEKAWTAAGLGDWAIIEGFHVLDAPGRRDAN